MKTRLLIIAVLMLVCTSLSAQNTGLIKATYDTNYGKLSLSVNFDTKQVTGFYGNNGGNGKILGTIDGNGRISGAWVQKEFGSLEFDFTKDFKTFTGKFGIGTALTSGVWKGTLISMEHVTGVEKVKPIERSGIYEAEYNTEYGLMKLIINFQKNEITGTYGVAGVVSGKLSKDNRLLGNWGRIDKGRLEFDFTPDFKNFTGKWGEKNNTLTDGTWMGESTVIKKVK